MAYLHALIQSSGRIWQRPFPCKLNRGESVAVISTKREIEHYFWLLQVPPNPSETYLYLMWDERTQLVKIGMSRKPEYRERTLQSDNPLIHLKRHWPASVRHERHLHKIFASDRKRGEWFDLTHEQIESIGQYMEAELRDQIIWEWHQKALARRKVEGQQHIDNRDISGWTGELIRVVPIEEVYQEPDTEDFLFSSVG